MLATARWGLLIIIIASSALLMLTASAGDAPIVDESPHIAAGYSYVRYLDYRLNPEHPPLVKMLAGLNLLFQGVNFPTAHDAWQKDINGQWTAGSQFLFGSGNDTDRVMGAARLGPILLTLILIVAVYIWSKDLLGRWWAFLPTFLVAFSPTFLAHGHYVTTDVGATLGVFLAIATYLNYLQRPSRKHMIWAGLAFGVAQLMKFSSFLLVPYLILITVVFCLVNKTIRWRELLYTFLLGYGLVYVVYFFLVWNYPTERQVADTEYLLSSFSPRILPEITAWLSGIPGLRPIAQYLLGLLMVFQRSSGGNTVYFLGEVSGAGSSFYFPLVFLMKEPVASLIMILFAAGYSLFAFVKTCVAAVFRRYAAITDFLTTYFAEFAILIFVIIYWASSVTSHLNIGIRHILPTMPFIYILTASVLKNWFSIKNLDAVHNFAMKIFILYQELVSVSIKSAVLGALLIWYLVSTLITAPYFLSYFNIISGGLRYGYQHVTDSNYDWGQDLKRLATFVETENINRIAVDYFGGGDAKYYLGEKAEYWWSSKGSPVNENIGWLAVSINTIQQAKGRLADGQRRNPEDEYMWLADPYKPFARAGTSIFIYKLQ